MSAAFCYLAAMNFEPWPGAAEEHSGMSGWWMDSHLWQVVVLDAVVEVFEAALTAAGGGARRRPVPVLVLDPAVTPHQPHLTAAGTRAGAGVRVTLYLALSPPANSIQVQLNKNIGRFFTIRYQFRLKCCAPTRLPNYVFSRDVRYGPRMNNVIHVHRG